MTPPSMKLMVVMRLGSPRVARAPMAAPAPEPPRPPAPSPGADGAAREIRQAQHQAADVLEAGRDAEAPAAEEEQEQRDGGDPCARNRPVEGRQVVEDERH